MEQFGPDIAKKYEVECLEQPQKVVGQPPQDPVEVFMRYPELTGWTRSDDGKWHNNTLQEQFQDNSKTKTKQINVMVQKWLFFELLHAFFHTDDAEFNYTDYIRSTGKKLYVKTDLLGKALSNWKDSFTGRLWKDRNRRVVQTYDVLIKARDEVSKYCAAEETDHAPGYSGSVWPVEPAISLSIIALGETLTNHLLKLHSDRRTDIEVGWRRRILETQSWGYSALVLDELKLNWNMQSSGRCPRLENILRMFRGNTVGLVLADHDRPNYSDHARCKFDVCKAKATWRVEERRLAAWNAGDYGGFDSKGEYQALDAKNPEPEPEHHDAKKRGGNPCLCRRHNQVNGQGIAQAVLNIIRSGQRPLFGLSPSGQLVIHAADDKKPFTVFSHAWIDGFGNDQDTNFIFDCNLRLLDQICRDRKPGHYRLSSDIPLFWIDALGIPVGAGFEESRKLAVQQIHEIYAAAEETIVLDEELLYRKDPGDPVVRAMRVTMSNWIERVWTLQEAFLSKKLTFIFGQDLEAVDADDLRDELSSSTVTAEACISAVAEKFYARTLRDKHTEHTQRVGSVRCIHNVTAPFVASVYEAVQYRRSSGLKDETEALAVMFNLRSYFENDERPPRTAPPELWMKWLVEKLSDANAIPAGLLFLDGEKLHIDGLRWAPKRWLNPQPFLTPNPLKVATGPSQTSNEGLTVTLPGMKLGFMSEDHACISETDHIQVMNLSRDNELYSIRPANKGDPFPSKEAIRGRKLAIITLEENVVQSETIALLVAENKHTTHTSYVQILNRVWLRREHDINKVHSFKECLHQRERNFLRKNYSSVPMLHVDVPRTQKWCVDGRPVDVGSDSSLPRSDDPFDYDPEPGIRHGSTWSYLKSRFRPETFTHGPTRRSTALPRADSPKNMYQRAKSALIPSRREPEEVKVTREEFVMPKS